MSLHTNVTMEKGCMNDTPPPDQAPRETGRKASWNGRAHLALPLIVAAAAFGLDRLTKVLIEEAMQLRVAVPIAGEYLRLVLWYNEGAAFGIRLGGPWVHIALSVAAMALVAYMAWHTPRGDALGLWGTGLILGGAVGNLYDRIAAGKVTDFIDVGIGTYRWPTFNVADSCVVVGIGLLIIAYMVAARQSEPEESGDVPREYTDASSAGDPSGETT